MRNITSARLALFTGLGAALCACPLPAQDSQSAERVLAWDGVSYAVQGGVTNKLLQPLSLPNDITVMTNAAFRVKEGKVRPLREGQVLSADGMLTSPDGSVVPVYDHVAMTKGHLIVVRDGDSFPLQEELVLEDGSTITPDGYYTKAYGGSTRLLDGQMFRLDGRPIPVQDTIMLSGGKVRVQKDGSSFEVPLDRSLMMNDGTKVLGDGTVIMPDGTNRKLAEGEILVVQGVVRKT